MSDLVERLRRRNEASFCSLRHEAAAEIERLRAVVDAARALRNFENTHNTADGDGFIKREELIMEITEAVCALDGEP